MIRHEGNILSDLKVKADELGIRIRPPSLICFVIINSKYNSQQSSLDPNARKEVSKNSYVNVVKSKFSTGLGDVDSGPAIVMDDGCLNPKDVSNALLGKVKEFASLSNLKTAFSNEGFTDVNVRYMGALWVLLEFATTESKDLFKKNMIFRGKVSWIRAKEVPGWIPDLLDESDDEDEMEEGILEDGSMKGDNNVNDSGSNGDNSDIEVVPDTSFDESNGSKKKTSEDPFNIYSILNRKDDQVDLGTKCDNLKTGNSFVEPIGSDEVRAFGGSKVESACSGSFKKSVAPRSGGSFLGLMEEVVKVGQTMGYNMEGLAQKAKKDWARELCVNNKVNFLAIQETKMEIMDLRCVKSCWGNYAFEYTHSNSVGNSGGILCVWDPGSFQKSNHTISDSFVILRGVWLKNGADLLVVVVYGPHDQREKRTLWDYLAHTINRWKGEVVMMGDFNEVRYKSDRFGSVFNAQGADEFNSFIVTAGLVEVQLGGSSFTWCHKSASKMSKLDRFFISENLLIKCPQISAITLDRYLSDHRPILLREVSYDYGPIPFRFFHHWLELDGFTTFVTNQWNIAPVDASNGLCNLIDAIDKFREELRLLDTSIDNGKGSDILDAKRMEVFNDLQNIEKLHAMDMAQKAKIKWSIEGDENS
ncbi:RNA-directed DNA polymerase, eukaryota [Tanacetum coccineum]